MKRACRNFTALLLSAVLLCTAFPGSALAASFSDVAQSAWYKDYVYDLTDKGILSGTGDSKFSPQANLTRAALATMLAKTALNENDLEQYTFKGNFKDVSQKNWANRYVNWAFEAGVISGYPDKTFRPNNPVSRQEMAVMVTNFAKATGRKIKAVNDAVTFSDSGSIAKYAAGSVKACQQAGLISGYKNGTFQPKGLATRAEAASVYSNFLKKCKTGTYQILRKRMYGTAIRAVEFDSSAYTADLVLGRDLVDGGESVSSMISRSGAVIAVNAAFFELDSYLPVGTMIKESRVVTVADLFAPETPSFTESPAGAFSIQNFSTTHTAVLHREGEEDIVLNKLGFNTWPTNEQDATRILFTRDWGHTLCFKARDAVTLDENGTVLAVDHDKDVEIPERGYVLAQRVRRWQEGNFFDSCKVGDTVEIQRSYNGASSQDIILSVASGPQLVKDGAVYGGLDTYQAEGFRDPNITTYDALRVCIGIKPDGKLILTTAYTSLAQLSKIMVDLGCKEAMNFDGGGSTNLYVDGQWLRGPQERPLNNMLIFR